MNYDSFVPPGSGATVQVARFVREGVEEVHLTAAPAPGGTTEERLAELWAGYRAALDRLGLPPGSAVFRRLFLSDYANQARAVAASAFAAPDPDDGPVALSTVEQPPLPDRKVALWAYHVHDPAGLRKEGTGRGVVVHRSGVSHLWTAGLSGANGRSPALGGANGEAPSAEQTRRIFGAWEEDLAAHGATVSRDVVRTWLFVRDVDLHYGGMVAARRELFEARGLTPDTHFITSTGIEGRHADPRRLVLLDAYAAPGLRPDQVRYLEAPDHLGPTSLYGVTFERGVRVGYGDRAHVLLSGTASIEPGGATLHVGDAARQTGRTLENIGALLEDAGAAPDDLAHLIVYLRDPADGATVERLVRERHPAVPSVFVRGAVCRPEWLVEMECMAITGRPEAGLPAF